MKMKASGADGRLAGARPTRNRTSGGRLVDKDWGCGLMRIGIVWEGRTYQCRRVADPSFNMALDIGLATIRVRGKDVHRALLRGECDPTAISGPVEVLDDGRSPPSTKIIHMPRGILLHKDENGVHYDRDRRSLTRTIGAVWPSSSCSP
jgi:hypothetical protein